MTGDAGFEIWASSGILPADLLERLPPPMPGQRGQTTDAQVFGIPNRPYWDPEVDIAWVPTARHEGDLLGERVAWGVVSKNRQSGSTRALEIWAASTIFPAQILEAFPGPEDVLFDDGR